MSAGTGAIPLTAKTVHFAIREWNDALATG
jgi:hypothetical protein